MDKSLFLAVIGSSAFAALITNIFTFIRDGKRQRKVNQILLLGEMERRLANYQAKGIISAEQLQVFNSIGDLYHAEGGNGYAESLLSAVRKIPMT